MCHHVETSCFLHCFSDLKESRDMRREPARIKINTLVGTMTDHETVRHKTVLSNVIENIILIVSSRERLA